MNSNSNSNPFWDFLNEAYRNGPGGASGQRGGPGRRGPQHNGGDFQNWQDMFANGFPFGPMPHRGRHGPPPPHPPPPGAYPPPPHPPPGPNEAHGSRPVSPPPRPSTPPTPPEELPQYPGGGAARRDRSQSPFPQHERSGDEHLPYDRRDARHQRREERRDVRHQERQERQDRRSDRRDERNEERRERRESRHYDAFGGPPPFFGGRRGGRHCGRGRGGLPLPIHELLNQLPYLVAQIPHYANQIPGLVDHYFPNGIPTAGTTDAAGRDVPAAEAGLPAGDGSFTIDVDVFSTSEAYLIHAAVPGAKKTDIDVSYDAAKNRVLISGVIQRPAEVDEVMLNSMIEGEREVGLFERYINLDDGVKVDAEGLRARLEDGILRIELPKLMEEDWTDVKKVPVE